MSTTGTVGDDERGGLSGLVPAPIASNTPAPSTQTGSTGLPEGESGSTNLIYIYSFLSTLFILLCIAILVLLRALVRRRRLDLMFNQVGGESSNDAAQEDADQRQQRQRKKKRQQLGSKPLMSEVWIGSGPVVSESTEALLQPFSVSRAPENENEKKPPFVAAAPLLLDATVELQQQEAVERKSPYPRQVPSFCQLPSSSSCTFDNNEKLGAAAAGGSETGHTSIGHGHSPISPWTPIATPMPLESLCVGVLIAMPRPRVGRDGSARWDEHLGEGEIPELSVGISTVYAPMDSSLVAPEQDIKAVEEPPSAPAREHRRRRRRHIPIPPHMTDYP